MTSVSGCHIDMGTPLPSPKGIPHKGALRGTRGDALDFVPCRSCNRAASARACEHLLPIHPSTPPRRRTPRPYHATSPAGQLGLCLVHANARALQEACACCWLEARCHDAGGGPALCHSRGCPRSRLSRQLQPLVFLCPRSGVELIVRACACACATGRGCGERHCQHCPCSWCSWCPSCRPRLLPFPHQNRRAACLLFWLMPARLNVRTV